MAKEKNHVHLVLSDELYQTLEEICERAGQDKTHVLTGMIEHWGIVMRQHAARGFRVVPEPGANFERVLAVDRSCDLDELPDPIATSGGAGSQRSLSSPDMTMAPAPVASGGNS